MQKYYTARIRSFTSLHNSPLPQLSQSCMQQLHGTSAPIPLTLFDTPSRMIFPIPKNNTT